MQILKKMKCNKYHFEMLPQRIFQVEIAIMCVQQFGHISF